MPKENLCTKAHLKKLTRDMTATRLDILSVKTASPSKTPNFKVYVEQLKDFGSNLSLYKDLNDPDFTAALLAYDALRKTLSAEYKTLQNKWASHKASK